MRGLRHHTLREKTKGLILSLIEHRADINILFDTHLDSDSEHLLTSEWEGEIAFNHGPDHKAGIAVLTRRQKISHFKGYLEGRFATFETTFSDHNLLVCVAYAPANSPESRTAFFLEMCNIIENSASPAREIVVIGDFNCVEACELDRLNANYPDPSVRTLRNIKAKFNLYDTFRYLRPEEKTYTFVSNRGQASRIDRAYAQDTLLRYLRGTDNPPNVYSDHTFLKLEFDFNGPAYGDSILTF